MDKSFAHLFTNPQDSKLEKLARFIFFLFIGACGLAGGVIAKFDYFTALHRGMMKSHPAPFGDSLEHDDKQMPEEQLEQVAFPQMRVMDIGISPQHDELTEPWAIRCRDLTRNKYRAKKYSILLFMTVVVAVWFALSSTEVLSPWLSESGVLVGGYLLASLLALGLNKYRTWRYGDLDQGIKGGGYPTILLLLATAGRIVLIGIIFYMPIANEIWPFVGSLCAVVVFIVLEWLFYDFLKSKLCFDNLPP
ncbi:MAG: hypothetical protein HRT35_28955 [Algicola sp.]|nr:hypothetical protein [Algicola sp.]